MQVTGQTEVRPAAGKLDQPLVARIVDVHGIGMETPLSGSQLGPHDRPSAPCNKTVSREAVCSSFTPFNAACTSINDQHPVHRR